MRAEWVLAFLLGPFIARVSMGINMKKTMAVLTSVLVMGLPAAVRAEEPSSQPVGAQQNIEITISGVEGLVQVRKAEDQPWQRAEAGMKLDQGAEFRTGPRSAVRFVIPPDQ